MTMTRVGWLVLVVGVAVVGLAAAEEVEQTYFEVVLAAHQAYDNQEWGASVALYDRAFSMRSPRAGDLYDAACAAALGGDAAKATAWLRAAADQGWSDFDWMEQDEDLALLEDRVLVRKGLPQIYGSQVQCDPKTWDHCYVLPIRDEATVNVLRARVGLEPLQQYLAQWDITWTPPTPTPNPPAGSAETNR